MLHQSPALKRVSAVFLMREVYEKTFGIYDHDHEKAHPLAHVLMHWSENAVDGSLMHERFKYFVRNQVSKHSGLSWFEYLSLPVDDARYIMEECDLETALEAKNADGLKNLLQGLR